MRKRRARILGHVGVGGLLHEYQQSREAREALAALRHQLAALTDPLQHRAEARGQRARRRERENTCAEITSISLPRCSSTSAIRLTIASSSPASSVAAEPQVAGWVWRVMDEAPDGHGIGVAIGDELPPGENEGDLRVLRQIGVELGDDRGRHEERALSS